MKNGIYLLMGASLVAFITILMDATNLIPQAGVIVLLIISALLLFAYLFTKYSKKKK